MLHCRALSILAILVVSVAAGVVANGPRASAQEINGPVGDPDLIVADMDIDPPNPNAGDVVSVDIEVRNVGAGGAGPFYVDLYQDLAGPPPPSEVGDSTCHIASLAAGASTICSNFVTYGSPGSFDAWAQVDADQEVSESNEDNNLGGPQKVDVNPAADRDLVVKSIDLSPGKPVAGEEVTVDVEVSNLGSVGTEGPFFVDFYQDRAGPPPPGEEGDIACDISSLAAGASTVCSGTVIYGAAGSYNAWAQVDTDQEVGETNESNNTLGLLEVDVNAAAATATPTNTPVMPTTTPTNTPVMPTTTPLAVMVGDADCSGFVDALDALSVLQFGAGLLALLRCPMEADVNVSGGVDAIDAVLILQFIADLISSLPP